MNERHELKANADAKSKLSNLQPSAYIYQRIIIKIHQNYFFTSPCMKNKILKMKPPSPWLVN